MAKVNKIDQFFIDHESKITKCMVAIGAGLCMSLYTDLAIASTGNDLLKDAMNGSSNGKVGIKSMVKDTLSGGFSYLIIGASVAWTAMLNSTAVNPKTWIIPFFTGGLVTYAPDVLDKSFAMTV